MNFKPFGHSVFLELFGNINGRESVILDHAIVNCYAIEYFANFDSKFRKFKQVTCKNCFLRDTQVRTSKNPFFELDWGFRAGVSVVGGIMQLKMDIIRHISEP